MGQIRNVALIVIIVLFAFLLLNLYSGKNMGSITGYGGVTDGSNFLNVSDDTDGGIIYRFDAVSFNANFTNSTGGTITDAEGSVTITFFDHTGPSYNTYNMTFNVSGDSQWQYTAENATATLYDGTFVYTTTANSSVYGANLIVNDTYTITYSCLNLTQNPVIPNPSLVYSVRQSETLCTDNYSGRTMEILADPLTGVIGSRVNDIILDCNGSTFNYSNPAFSKSGILVGWTDKNNANITIQNCNFLNQGRNAIEVRNSSNITIINVTAYNSTGGESIYVSNAAGVAIDNANLDNLNVSGGMDLYLENSRDVLVRNTNLKRTNIIADTNVTFDNLSVYDSDQEVIGGCDYSLCENITVVNSNFFNDSNTWGEVGLGRTKGMNVSNNFFNQSVPSYLGNINTLYSSSNSIFYNNTFIDSVFAMLITGDNNTVSNNNGNGLIWLETSNSVAADNDIENFPVCFYLRNSNGISLENNTCANSTNAAWAANSTAAFIGNTFLNISDSAIWVNDTNATLKGAGNYLGSGVSFVSAINSNMVIRDLAHTSNFSVPVIRLTNASLSMKNSSISGDFTSVFFANTAVYLINGPLVVYNSSIIGNANSQVYMTGGGAYSSIVNFTNNFIGIPKLDINADASADIILNGNYFNSSHIKLQGSTYITEPFRGNIFDRNSTLYLYSHNVLSNFSDNVFSNDSHIIHMSLITGSSSPLLINNTFSNIENYSAIILTSATSDPNPNSTIENNTFINVGKIAPGYYSDFAYAEYNGTNFSGCIIWTNGLAGTIFTSAGEQKVALADGSVNFGIALYNDSAGNFSSAGCGENVTIYTSGLNCGGINGLGYPGNCYYELQAVAVLANGSGKNYFWNSTLAADGIRFSEVPYLSFDNSSKSQKVWAINISSDDNKIKGNVFTGNRMSPILLNNVSGVSEPSNSKIYLNVFASGNVTNNGTGNSFCYNGNGNFYEESLAPVSGDCGQVTLGASTFTTELSFTSQSSPIQPVSYDVFYNIGAAFSILGTVTASPFTWPLNTNGLYNIKILPWITVSGTRINGTSLLAPVTKRGIAPSGGTSGGGNSVDMPPYYGKTAIAEEPSAEAPQQKPTEVVPAQPVPSAPAPVTPQVQKPAPVPVRKPLVPAWVPAVIVMVAVGVVLFSIIAYQIYLRRAKPPMFPGRPIPPSP